MSIIAAADDYFNHSLTIGLPDLKKQFYVEDPSVAKMSDSEVCDFR